MNYKYDIVIAIVPQILFEPLHGPALLKAVIQEAGFTCRVVDWNIDLWQRIGKNNKWDVLWDLKDLTFRKRDKFDKVWQEIKSDITKVWIRSLQSLNPRWLGVTLFSNRNMFMAEKIIQIVRRKLPNTKIVIGGPYARLGFKKFNNPRLVDAYILGEGELPIIGLLKGDVDTPGLNDNPPQWIEDLNALPFPDYSDYDFSLYPRSQKTFGSKDSENMGLNLLSITGSRGCINKCSYCDNCSLSPKFRYRKGEDIAQEMIFLRKKYKSIRSIVFTDCLINGNIKELRKFSQTLIDYCQKNNIPPLKWSGQFVCRSKNQMTANDYKLIKQAGLLCLSIGIESGSEKVRRDMNKNFSNGDIDFMLRQCENNIIEMHLQFIVGYPRETEENFQETLDFFSRYSDLAKSGLIRSVILGPTCCILKGSPLHEKQKQIGITYDKLGHWVYRKAGNTMETRIKRWFRLKKHCEKLGYSVDARNLNHLKQELKRIR